MSSAEERPTLRLVRGDASAEEIAALLAVIVAEAGESAEAATPTKPVVPSGWTNRAATLRRLDAHGPGAWRASGWPR